MQDTKKVEVWRNGETVLKCFSSAEVWAYIDKQTDKDIAKYTIFDAR